MSLNYKYPVYKPTLNGNEKKYVNECLDTTWISSKGRFVDEFPHKFAEFINIKYATGVCNGTVAIHLALVSLGITHGDEVIVPTYTYIASANPITQTGAIPVFVDSLEDTWQMSPESIEKKITEKTRAIMVVHLYGHPCDMDAIIKIAQIHKLLVIEDCAEAFGSKYNGQYVGTFGDIAAFSFYGNKTITCGEGGMVVTNNNTLHERVVHLKGQGLAKNREYWHDVIGFNYRMTNIQAAIGLAQLERAREFIQTKQDIADWYMNQLKDLPVKFHSPVGNVTHTFWMCSLLTQNEQTRDSLREHLRNHDIETRPTFFPIHTMPIYAEKYESLPVAEDISRRGVNLPSYPALTKKDIIFISDIITDFFRNN
jgi:perosamine synthetase